MVVKNISLFENIVKLVHYCLYYIENGQNYIGFYNPLSRLQEDMKLLNMVIYLIEGSFKKFKLILSSY